MRTFVPPVLAVVVLIAGCASAHAARSTDPASVHLVRTGPVPALPDCAPSSRKLAGRSSDPDAGTQLLPDGEPAAVRICRYDGLNVPHPGTLARSRTLRGHAAWRLTAVIDSMPLRSLPKGPISCPADLGSDATLSFAFRGAAPVTLLYRYTGCSTVSNGDLTVMPEGRFPAAVTGLIGQPRG